MIKIFRIREHIPRFYQGKALSLDTNPCSYQTIRLYSLLGNVNRHITLSVFSEDESGNIKTSGY